jgi:hypothetical protein
MEYKITIVLQFFIKKDYLEEIIFKLSNLTNIHKYNVIFWQDSLINSKYYDYQKYIDEYDECSNIINNNLYLFKNVEFKKNKRNLGTCKTCETCMNYAFTKSEYAILMEDDVVPSNNFLSFFEFFIDNNMLSFENKILLIAAESVFFDSKKKTPDIEHIQLCNTMIDTYNLNKYYITFNFVPSSCFCTNYDIWKKISSIRGQPVGATIINDYFKVNNFTTIMPIVACCKDIGMINTNGYSVTLHGIDKILDKVKNTYILNEINTSSYELYSNINTNALYDFSCNLNHSSCYKIFK